MIERLRESDDKAFGFRAVGTVTAEDVEAFEPQLELAIGRRGKRTIGILADLSAMQGIEWAARWEEIKFLSRSAEHIERVAIVGAGKWESVKAQVLAGTVLIQAETRYYAAADILHAWHWVKTGDAVGVAGQPILRKDALMKGYVPEYSEV
ncbi:MAG: STAS/SEC14 domain-containing protein [Acidobacteriota bacterium]